MTPDERQLLAGLFDRIRAGANGPRDPEAANFIDTAVRAEPAAAYLLTQAVIVQAQALKAANDRLQQLEAQTQTLQRDLELARSNSQPAETGGSFLSGLGKSIFGAGAPTTPQFGGPPSSAVPPRSPWGAPGQSMPQAPPPSGWGNSAAQSQSYPPPQAAWGAPQQAPQPQQGGSFLHGALGAAAGVAGGVLLADSIRGLFGGHGGGLGGGLGIGSGFGGTGLGGAGFGAGGLGGPQETTINNYYENGGSGSDQGPNIGSNLSSDTSTILPDNSDQDDDSDDGYDGGNDDDSGTTDV